MVLVSFTLDLAVADTFHHPNSLRTYLIKEMQPEYNDNHLISSTTADWKKQTVDQHSGTEKSKRTPKFSWT